MPNTARLDKTIADVHEHLGIDLSSVLRDESRSPKQRLAAVKPLIDAAVERKLSLAPGALSDPSGMVVRMPDGSDVPDVTKIPSDIPPQPPGGDAPASAPCIWINQATYNSLVTASGDDITKQVGKLHDALLTAGKSTEAMAVGAALAGAGIISLGVGSAIFISAVATVYAAGGVSMTLGFAIGAVLAASTVPLLGAIIAGAFFLAVGLAIFFASLSGREVWGAVLNTTPYNLQLVNYPAGCDGELNNGVYLKHGEMVSCMYNVTPNGSVVSLPGFTPNSNLWTCPVGLFHSSMVPGTRAYGTEGMLALSNPNLTEQAILQFDCPLYESPAGVNADVLASGTIPDQANYYNGLDAKRSPQATATGSVIQASIRMNTPKMGENNAVVALVSPVAS